MTILTYQGRSLYRDDIGARTMGRHSYTAEQLLNLKESPLVQRPDNLPSIEQWIEWVILEVPSLLYQLTRSLANRTSKTSASLAPKVVDKKSPHRWVILPLAVLLYYRQGSLHGPQQQAVRFLDVIIEYLTN